MSQLTELAMYMKECKNPLPYSPMFGTVTALPEYKIKLSERVTLTSDNSSVKFLFDIYEKEYDSDGNFIRYTNLNKEIVLLPYSDENKFIAIGVVQ